MKDKVKQFVKNLSDGGKLTEMQSKKFVEYMIEAAKNPPKVMCSRCNESIGYCLCPFRWEPWQLEVRRQLLEGAREGTLDMVMEIVSELRSLREQANRVHVAWQTKCSPLGDPSDKGRCGCNQHDARDCMISEMQDGIDSQQLLYQLHKALPEAFQAPDPVPGVRLEMDPHKWKEAIESYIKDPNPQDLLCQGPCGGEYSAGYPGCAGEYDDCPWGR